MLTEETTNTALEGSAFARVLGRLMETRSIPADEEHALELAERSGLDRDVFRGRLAAEPDAEPGDLSGLADTLNLSRSERRDLACAYTFEREAPMTLHADISVKLEAGKTVAELREEYGLSREDLARGMDVSVRDLEMLEASGQRYHGLNPEWFVLLTEPYGHNRAFWYPPAKAIEEWKRAITILEGFTTLAFSLESDPLMAVLGDALAGAREELDGCRDLLANFERQEERVRIEAARD